MATAQKFYADGRGNGFPDCLQTIIESEIEGTYVLLTLKEMMRLFWNIQGASTNGSATYSQDASGSDPALSVKASGGVSASLMEEPFKRVCPDFSESETDRIDDDDPGNYDPEGFTGVSAFASVSIRVGTINPVSVYRVVNGSGGVVGYTFTSGFVMANADFHAVWNTEVYFGGVSKMLTGWTQFKSPFPSGFSVTDVTIDGITLKQVTRETSSLGGSASVDDPTVTFWEYA